MKINWYGKGCFTISNDKAKFLMDPYSAEVKDKVGDDIDVVLLPSEKVSYKHDLVFDWPGEYEAKGIGVVSLDFKNSKDEDLNIFVLQVDKVRICHLGRLDRDLTDEELVTVGGVDILFVPVGGSTVMDAKTAHKVVEKIDPRMIIPMYYSVGDEAEGFAPIDTFKLEMGVKGDIEIQKTLTVKTLPEDATQIVILEKN